MVSRLMAAREVDEFVGRYGHLVLRTARRFSANAADAEDAYQRGLEKLITKAPNEDDEGLLRWLTTVVRNEALMIRRGARRTVASIDALEAAPDGTVPDPSEQVVGREHIDQAREAIALMRPEHLRCLLLKAEGVRYERIAEITGYSEAQVGRFLSQGRKAFRTHLGRVSSGAECLRLEPLLSRLSDDIADVEARREVEPHLSKCRACQTTLREYRSTPREVAALLPVGAVASGWRQGAEQIAGWIDSLTASVGQRIAGHVGALQPGAEMAAAKKAVVVAAAAAALAGGGAAYELGVGDKAPDGVVVDVPTAAVTAPAGAVAPDPARPEEPAATDPDREREKDERESREATEADLMPARRDDRDARGQSRDSAATRDSEGRSAGQDYQEPLPADDLPDELPTDAPADTPAGDPIGGGAPLTEELP